MKISQQHRTNTKTKYNPETPQNNWNELKKYTQSDYSIDAPRSHNPDLVCDLATRQSRQLTNEHAYLLTIVTVGVQERFTVYLREITKTTNMLADILARGPHTPNV